MSFVNQMGSLSDDVTGALLDRDLLYRFGARSRFDDDPPQLLTRLTSSRRMWEADVTILDTSGDVLRYDPTFEELVADSDRRRAAQNVVAFFRRVARSEGTVVLTLDPSVRRQTSSSS